VYVKFELKPWKLMKKSSLTANGVCLNMIAAQYPGRRTQLPRS
jgi:hypothetical protein